MDESVTTTSGVKVQDGFGRSETRALLKRHSVSDMSKGTHGKWMDDERKKLIAYEYLCHLEEAKQWIEACIQEQLPTTTEMEEALTNGVYLCKLAMFFCPTAVTKKKIYDFDLTVFKEHGLKFRHTDNINHWVTAMEKAGLPTIFYPTTTDLYDRKNLPKVIYCIHALSHFLFKKGIAPKIKDLVGKAQFTDDEINAMNKQLKESGIEMPSFGKISGILSSELPDGDAELHAAIAKINEAIDKGVASDTLDALNNDAAELNGVAGDRRDSYQQALAAAKSTKGARSDAKAAAKGPDAPPSTDMYDKYLTRDEIQEQVDDVNFRAAIAEINAAVAAADESRTLRALQNPIAKIHFVKLQHAAHYLDFLARGMALKARIIANADAAAAAGSSVSVAAPDAASAVVVTAAASDAVHANGETPAPTAEVASKTLNVSSSTKSMRRMSVNERAPIISAFGESGKEAAAVDAAEFGVDLTQTEIQVAVNKANKAVEREELLLRSEPAIIKLQARIRGNLVRREFAARQKHFEDNVDKIVKIQRWWRAQKERRLREAREKHFRDNEEKIIKMQAFIRGLLERRRYKEHLKRFNDNVDKIKKLQGAIKGFQARKNYLALTSGNDVSPSTLSRFLHLLDQSDVDFEEELELSRLKQRVVIGIRDNGKLEQELNALDLKIGLLVRNRITLEDVVKHTKKISKRKTNGDDNLKSLSKEKRVQLEHYQHMFYLLQTQPKYFAKLIFVMPQSRTTKFMENVILTVFNFAQNAREECLLLKLFREAILEEMERVTEMRDFITGNPTVIKMMLQYNRGAREMTFLRELLQPLVSSVMDNRDINLNTSPIDIYKGWINKMEAETGKASELAYDVTNEQALEHANVREEFEKHVADLKVATRRFQDAIIAALERMPFGIRYIAMHLRKVVATKFPQASEDEVLKVVGNLVYYRYMNPAIVAPDAFDVVGGGGSVGGSLGGDLLSPLQRRNLGEVAKLLQRIAANNSFGANESYLEPLNSFITESWVSFRDYLVRTSTVAEAEEH
eukprot:Opistho-2@90503